MQHIINLHTNHDTIPLHHYTFELHELKELKGQQIKCNKCDNKAQYIATDTTYCWAHAQIINFNPNVKN